MKISTRAHYGLRAMVTLARLSVTSNQPVSVADLAKAEDLPENYLEQLVGALRRGGLLKSYRGAYGGYQLTRPATEISALDVLNAVGEKLDFPECTTTGCTRSLVRGEECECAPFWRVLNNAMQFTASHITIQHLMENKMPTDFVHLDFMQGPTE